MASDEAAAAFPALKAEPIDAEGGCACGAVRYRVRGRPLFVTLCHCADCRRASGATPVAWAVFKKTALRWLTHEPKERASSDRAFRSFCTECGSQLGFRYKQYPDHVDITVATLDNPELLAPRQHIFVRSRVDWMPIGDELPQHDGDLPTPGA